MASEIENNNKDEFCKRICSVIASGAAIAEPPFNPIMRIIGRLLSVVLPRFTISSGLNTNHISRDQSVVCAYKDDPQVSSEITARWATEFLKAMQRVQSNAHRQRTPIFMYHGGEDQIIPADASRQYFRHMKLPDKQLKIYAGGFHEPHNDLQKLEVFKDIECWMDKQEQFYFLRTAASPRFDC